MADRDEITNALSIVESSAAHLEAIAQSQDEEFRRLLCELAQNCRLMSAILMPLSDLESAHGSLAA